MPCVLDKVENIIPGTPTVVVSMSKGGGFAVVFEDDGTTGYFYACAGEEGPIHDALHVYDVEDLTDRDVFSTFKIGWSPSARQAVLIVNGLPHAVFDFDRKRGWCRDGFPPSQGDWSEEGHDWDDECLDCFR